MFYTFPPYVHNMNIDDSNGYLKKLPAKWSEIPQLDPRSARVSTRKKDVASDCLF